MKLSRISMVATLAALVFDGSVVWPARATSWVTNGTMATARGFHTATLLPNGKVLVAGGSDASSVKNLVELSRRQKYFHRDRP